MTYFSAMALLAVFLFNSCDEIPVVSSAITVDQLPKASISGYVTSEMNLLTNGQELVPEGTRLLIEVSYSDLNAAATAGKWQDTVSVGTNGKYEVAVPADANGVTVTITPFAFESDQTQAYGALLPKVLKSYTVAQSTLSIRSGQVLTKDISYTANNLPNFTDKVRVSGKVQANLNAETVGLESVPDGTILNFYNGQWKDSVSVKNGTYSIVVPIGDAVICKAKFKCNKKVWVTDYVTLSNSAYANVSYEYTVSGMTSYSANSENMDLTAGEGKDLTVDPNANLVVVSGNALADIDGTTYGLENMPNGAQIVFYTTQWGATAIVNNGKYSVRIPKNTSVNYCIKFTTYKKLSSTSVKSYIYEYTGTLNPSSYPINLDLNAGNGTEATISNN